MTSFVLKIIAIISMLSDHVGYTIFNKVTFCNFIGKISFPIFAFLISEGYLHTKNLKKYLIRLILFALLSQIPFMLFFSTFNIYGFNLNIFFTLLLGLISIIIYEKTDKSFISIIIFLLLAILAQITNCDYGFFGVCLIFLFHAFKNNKFKMNISILLITLIRYSLLFFTSLNINYIYFGIFSCISLIFINLYNNKKGKNIKYFFYIFYPLHLLILYFIRILF